LIQKQCTSRDATFVVEDVVNIPGIQRPQIVDVNVAAVSPTDDLADVKPDDDASVSGGIAVRDDTDTVDAGDDGDSASQADCPRLVRGHKKGIVLVLGSFLFAKDKTHKGNTYWRCTEVGHALQVGSVTVDVRLLSLVPRRTLIHQRLLSLSVVQPSPTCAVK